MPESDIKLRAATHDGYDKVDMHIIWKGQDIHAYYSGGTYTHVEVGKYTEVIHHDQEDTIRKMWSEETSTKIGLLFVELENWCRTNDHENPGWVREMLEFGQWS